MNCNHQFIELGQTSRPTIGVTVVCALCGQVREVFQNGIVNIKINSGFVREVYGETEI